MKTFKQFLAEIDHDDDVYHKDASDWSAARAPITGLKPLLKLENGEQVMWAPNLPAKDYYKVAMVDGEKVAVLMELQHREFKVPGGRLIGVSVPSLSSRTEYRGKGLPAKIYQALIDHGQVLFSSDSQTTGSRRLWEALAQRNTTFVLATDSAARFYAHRYEQHEGQPNVLLTGSFKRMNDEAYASEETRWVIVPKDLPGLDRLQQEAISLD
jgi:hypothetical protein